MSKALASICKHVNKKAVGKVIIGWTGKEQPAEQDTNMLGLDLTIEALSHYNFAENNNYLVDKHCMSDCVLFMNDDVEIAEGDPVTSMLKVLEDKDVGTVGIKLLYPNGTIQHAGQFVATKSDGTFRSCGHLMWKQPDRDLGNKPWIVIGNTGAFLMMRRHDFLKVGGFDEGYKKCFEDL